MTALIVVMVEGGGDLSTEDLRTRGGGGGAFNILHKQSKQAMSTHKHTGVRSPL